MLNTGYIRNQLLLVATPGMWTEHTLRNIQSEAERYAQERVVQETKGTLFTTTTPQDPRMKLAAEDLKEVLAIIRNWRKP